MSIPEPKTFNGGPGETGGYVGRSTGPKREPDVPSGERPPVCQHCAGPVLTVFSLADVGVFCSFACRKAATVPPKQSEVA